MGLSRDIKKGLDKDGSRFTKSLEGGDVQAIRPNSFSGRHAGDDGFNFMQLYRRERQAIAQGVGGSGIVSSLCT
jgi:hypothetical protein